MTIKQKIFNSLVERRQQRTAAQLAAQLKTTRATVIARISEIRDEGYAIETHRRTDLAGRTKTFYSLGTPSIEVVKAGRLLQKMMK